ncbi:MAG TPA: hypothetical protein VK701_02895 [Solirubrobacteraceae bacterium]|nr:hypothetical protein [Solirubrobacteraceae bacterium]
MLELAGESFSEVAGAGGMNGPVPGAAAFAEPNQGFIADGVSTGISVDGQGQAPLIEVTTRPAGDELGEESVPFRRPLYAVTQAPGSLPGDANAQAIAVGAEGEVTHYVPGQGWQSESLYAATSQTPPSSPPTLRGVAWPTPERAYAVGDNGAMWMWQAATGLWGPDPGKPFNFVGQLTAIAFSGVDPNVGYAVGRQGVLLHFGKSWEQEPICGPGVSETCLSAELAQVNFTSVTFAGTEAFATYRTLEGLNEVGGVAVREGAGAWHVDSGVMALLAQAHLPSTQTVLSRIAGLPDGGVVAAGPGLVIERDTPSSTWRFSPQPLPEAQSISALAAYRESSGAVRAVVSIDLDGYLNPQRWDGPNVLDGERSPFGPVDIPPLTAEGAPPAQLPPDLLPNSGYMLKETANGWLDMEHEALPDTGTEDRPDRPDPVLALLVSPSGSSGLAVGGQVGDIEGFGPSPNHETAAAMRYPASDASSDGASPAPVFTTPGKASFVVAAGAKCIASCTDFLHEGIGPEAWLAHALLSANNIAKGSAGGLRAFLYDGSQGGGEDVFSRYLSGHQEVLPTYGPEGGGAGDEPGPAGTIAYSFISEGSGGPVSVIMLDCSKLEDPKLEEAQLGWVEEKLGQAKAAKTPAIVIGADSLEFTLPEPYGPRAVFLAQAVASKLSSILIRGGASAYFFDYPESNVHAEISKPGFQALQVYGTGTLGYIDTNENSNGFHDALGSSGFLVTEVETAARNPATNVAPVNVKVVPNISQLALDATNGVLLHRSQVALFEALARRADGGEAMRQGNNPEWTGPDPYDPIPFDCRGPNCAYEVSSDYTFSSSNPDIGGFVAHGPSSEEPRQVLLGANHLAVPDEPRNANGELNAGGHFSENSKGEPVNEKGEVVARDQSGTFCPYNAGTTIVSIAAGGLTYSEPVTVQAGSVEYPCGTVPLKHPPILRAPVSTNFNVVEPSSPGPGSPNPQLQTLLPPPPPHPPLHHKPPHHRRPHVTPAAFLPAAAGLALLRPAILPPPPTAARPSPPSGTSSAQVYQSAVAPESEREEQEAIDMVHNMAVYSREPRRPVPYYLPAVILLLALAGAGLYDAGRRARPRLARNGQE